MPPKRKQAATAAAPQTKRQQTLHATKQQEADKNEAAGERKNGNRKRSAAATADEGSSSSSQPANTKVVRTPRHIGDIAAGTFIACMQSPISSIDVAVVAALPWLRQNVLRFILPCLIFFCC